MVTTSNDTFNVPELYLMAAAFKGNTLFGIPDKQTYQLKGSAIFEEAHHRLIGKGILSTEGKLTKNGAVIISVLKEYYSSKKFVRINHLMFAFRDEKAEELIILAEMEEQKAYKLHVVAKPIILKMLSDKLPLILREPDESEKGFLKKELTSEEKKSIQSFQPSDQSINFERFQLNESKKEATNPEYYQQWLIFEKDEKLMMVDTVQKEYYHASQYWFLKILFDELDFPYKEGTVV
ncbi:DUF5081 family protein [Alkalihalobacillus trypoxylicola]|uniref:DUF5081 domain-containing protein n=1 Tax=Alkalihalobacillus trypoxylicola TaxID=519424 RepID=A0A162CQJ1_9BACI|nr:DUF5081 family protein [Alkalihalobacillus trypoxylicola]KYG26031.1 hypothetical protein AZF04_13170 [Alkalihalobacillus trypoxylicola]